MIIQITRVIRCRQPRMILSFIRMLCSVSSWIYALNRINQSAVLPLSCLIVLFIVFGTSVPVHACTHTCKRYTAPRRRTEHGKDASRTSMFAFRGLAVRCQCNKQETERERERESG